MKAIGRSLLLVLIVGSSLRLIDVCLVLLAAQADGRSLNFFYSMGRLAGSVLLLVGLIAAFRRLGTGKASTPPPLPGRGQ